MTATKILVRNEGKGKPPLAPSPEAGWQLLGTVGWLFAVIAATDQALTWYPLRFGNAEWEFGTATTVLEHLPLVTMGLALAYGAAAARGARGTLRFGSVLMLILALMAVLCGGLLAKNAGVAQRSVTDPVLRMGLDRSIVTSTIQAVTYPIALVWLSIKGWKHAGLA